MSFKFKHRKPNLIEGDFVDGDQTLHLFIDPDVITGDKMKEIKKKIAATKSDSDSEIDVRGIEFMSEMLGLIIKKWDAEDAEPTAKFFMSMPTAFVRDLLEFCTGLMNPKAQTAGA